MQEMDFLRMIQNGQLKELSEINNLINLTQYQYLKRYILEYLLEKNIHTTRMDNYAVDNTRWIELYVKYHISEPLVNVSLVRLLDLRINTKSSKNRILLDIVLDELDDKQKLKLYQNFIKNDYFLYRIHEREILEVFKKHGITLTPVFIKLPEILDIKVSVDSEFQELLDEFKRIYHYIDEYTLNIYITEIKREYKYNRKRAYIDLKKIISYSEEDQRFDFTILDRIEWIKNYGQYRGDGEIIIERFFKDTFHHEFSHFLFQEYETKENDKELEIYNRKRKLVYKQNYKKRIINYIKDFHKRFKYMKSIFEELYNTEIKKKYKSMENFKQALLNKVYENQNESPYEFDSNIFVDEEEFNELFEEILEKDKEAFIKIMLENYYREELSLENLLDALLLGKTRRIFEIDKLLSYHKENYYKGNMDLSFNEVLANYEAIKNSFQSKIIIKKLRSIVGDNFVDFLDEYISKYREQDNIELIR